MTHYIFILRAVGHLVRTWKVFRKHCFSFYYRHTVTCLHQGITLQRICRLEKMNHEYVLWSWSRRPSCVLVVCALADQKYIKHHIAQTVMTIWCSGGSEMLTLCMLLLSWRCLASQWLLASVGWSALARRGGSSWWCQRKSCPSHCLSFVGPMFSYSKQKNKKRNTGRWFTMQWWCWLGAEQSEHPWRYNSHPCDLEGAEAIYTLVTQGCFFLWRLVTICLVYWENQFEFVWQTSSVTFFL